MVGGETGQRGDDAVEIAFDRARCGAQFEDASGVECVLAGGPVVDVARRVGRIARDERRKLLDERNRKVSRGWHRLYNSREVKTFRAAPGGNGGCGVLRNYSRANLGPREGCFKIENSLDGGDIGE